MQSAMAYVLLLCICCTTVLSSRAVDELENAGESAEGSNVLRGTGAAPAPISEGLREGIIESASSEINADVHPVLPLDATVHEFIANVRSIGPGFVAFTNAKDLMSLKKQVELTEKLEESVCMPIIRRMARVPPFSDYAWAGHFERLQGFQDIMLYNIKPAKLNSVTLVQSIREIIIRHLTEYEEMMRLHMSFVATGLLSEDRQEQVKVYMRNTMPLVTKTLVLAQSVLPMLKATDELLHLQKLSTIAHELAALDACLLQSVSSLWDGIPSKNIFKRYNRTPLLMLEEVQKEV